MGYEILKIVAAVVYLLGLFVFLGHLLKGTAYTQSTNTPAAFLFSCILAALWPLWFVIMLIRESLRP